MNRAEVKKSALESNNVGSRLFFIRSKLNVNLPYVSKITNVPTSTLHDWEMGVRTAFYEDLLLIAYYYNKLWQSKYFKFNSYPSYKGDELRNISCMWIMFGFDEDKKDFDILLDNIKNNYQAMLDKQNEIIKQMEKQLDIEDIISYNP